MNQWEQHFVDVTLIRIDLIDLCIYSMWKKPLVLGRSNTLARQTYISIHNQISSGNPEELQ